MFYWLIISHFLLDYGYALSPGMVRAKKTGKEPFLVLLHGTVHALGVTLVLLAYGVDYLIILKAFHLEQATHTAINLGKTWIQNKYEVLQDSSNKLYWHLFQVDQFLHISVKYAIFLMAIGKITLGF